MNLNRIELIGRVTKQPELKALPSGAKVCSFGIATNNTFKNKNGEKVENTTFHNCVVFGKIAEVIAQYVIKGQEIYVDGRIENRSWDKDGVKHYRTEVLVNNFQFGQKPKGSENVQPAKQDVAGMSEEFSEEEINPDDIPF